VRRPDLGDRAGRHRRVGRVALEHVAERVRINLCRVAAAQDGVRAERGDLVVDLDFEVVQGDAQRRERRGPDQAGGEGAGGFRLQETRAAAAVDLCRGRAAREVVGDAGGTAVPAEVLVGAAAPVDAGVQAKLWGEARQVAEVELVQARGAVRGALGG